MFRADVEFPLAGFAAIRIVLSHCANNPNLLTMRAGLNPNIEFIRCERIAFLCLGYFHKCSSLQQSQGLLPLFVHIEPTLVPNHDARANSGAANEFLT
jgi:hypothetical protein